MMINVTNGGRKFASALVVIMKGSSKPANTKQVASHPVLKVHTLVLAGLALLAALVWT